MFSDEDLALRIKRGDSNALATLVERHHGRLLGYLYRMTNGDRALAEDLAQESFLRVLRSIGSYQYPRPFKAWLYGIATNLVRDHFKRAETRCVAITPDEKLGRIADERAGPEGVVNTRDEVARVAAAIAALPEGQRAVVVLRYYQELSLVEISDALDIPVGTVKSRLSIGLKKLRAQMEG